MHPPFIQLHLKHEARITRNPHAGQTGMRIIGQNLPCTTPYPANKVQWEYNSEIEALEMFVKGGEKSRNEDSIEVNGVVYVIKKRKIYGDYTHLLIEQRDR